MEEMFRFQLSTEEFGFLKQLAASDESICDLLSSNANADGQRMVIRLSRVEAEHLRDFLTTNLAEIGFDEKYSPNAEGDLLEHLIDKFYVP